MDKFQYVLAVIIRIAAILLLLRGLSYLPAWYISFSSGQINPLQIAFSIAYSLFVICGAALLWRFPLSIARQIIPAVASTEQIPDIALARLQAALLSVFGIMLVIYNVPDIIFRYAYLHYLKETSDPSYPIDFGVYVVLYRSLLYIFFGIWLALGSNGIVQIVNRLRYAGSQK